MPPRPPFSKVPVAPAAGRSLERNGFQLSAPVALLQLQGSALPEVKPLPGVPPPAGTDECKSVKTHASQSSRGQPGKGHSNSRASRGCVEPASQLAFSHCPSCFLFSSIAIDSKGTPKETAYLLNSVLGSASQNPTCHNIVQFPAHSIGV